MRRAQKKYTVDPHRRRFLAQSASAATGAAIALASGKPGWYAWAEAQARRPALISIHLPGGWDTNWFHMAFPKQKISSAPDNPNLVSGLPESLKNASLCGPAATSCPFTGSDPFGRKVDVDADTGKQITEFYHSSYTERTKSDQLVAHPRTPGHYLGLGAQLALGNDLSILDKVCIWKGIQSGGAHSIPNKAIIHGSQSQYAIPYSGLIAEALATRHGKLPLNYVQLTASPAVFGANWAMSTGSQIPINVPDHQAFVDLTRRSTNDFQRDASYDRLNASVDTLGTQIGINQLSLSRSRSIYDSFMSFFRGAVGIAGMGNEQVLGTILDKWVEYAEHVRLRLVEMHSRSFIDKISPDVSEPFMNQAYNYHLYAPIVPGLTPRGGSTELGAPTTSNYAIDQAKISTLNTALSTPFDKLSIAAFGPASDAFGTGIRSTIAQYAWKFAMADFLISTDKSAVVDLAFGTPDAHGNNSTEFRQIAMIYTLWVKLLRELQRTGNLDRTTVAMYSEFDRTAGMLTEVDRDNRGTGHGATASILLAGYGIHGGIVVGDRDYGPGSAGRPMPITYQAGKPPQIVDYQFVFPTIMAIFGVMIPPQQISDGDFVRAVMA